MSKMKFKRLLKWMVGKGQRGINIVDMEISGEGRKG